MVAINMDTPYGKITGAIDRRTLDTLDNILFQLKCAHSEYYSEKDWEAWKASQAEIERLYAQYER